MRSISQIFAFIHVHFPFFLLFSQFHYLVTSSRRLGLLSFLFIKPITTTLDDPVLYLGLVTLIQASKGKQSTKKPIQVGD